MQFGKAFKMISFALQILASVKFLLNDAQQFKRSRSEYLFLAQLAQLLLFCISGR